MLTNNEIVTIYLENGLIDRCVDCQWAKKKNGKRNKDDFYQDLILTLLEYDNGKMNDAHDNNHFNALITRIITNNIFSKTSPYYTKYEKWDDREVEITDKELNIADEG